MNKSQDSGFISRYLPVFYQSQPSRSDTRLEIVITKHYTRRTASETSIGTTNCSDCGSRTGVEFDTVKVRYATILFKEVELRNCLFNSKIFVVEDALNQFSTSIVLQQLSYFAGNAFYN